jgi:hypothetical protein
LLDSSEGPHGYFKRRLCQALYRRGSFEFESVSQYQAFIEQVIAKLNAKCQKKFETEQPYLQPLPRYRTPDYEILSASVSTYSTITVRCIVYTVPSRLIGQRLTLHLYHDRLVGFLGTTQVFELARVHIHSSQKTRRARSIQYRHVAESLRRKPRAFLYCQWQDDLLPNDRWRAVWETLKTQFDSDQAARLMTEALYIAATQDKELQVAEYLEIQCQGASLTLIGLQRSFASKLDAEHLPSVTSVQHDLSSYDQLLNRISEPSRADPNNQLLDYTLGESLDANDQFFDSTSGQSLPGLDDIPQATQAQTLPRRVAEPGTSSSPRALVLCTLSPGFGSRRSQSQRTQPDCTRSVRSSVALRKVLDEF